MIFTQLFPVTDGEPQRHRSPNHLKYVIEILQNCADIFRFTVYDVLVIGYCLSLGHSIGQLATKQE
jgi:hypothetical protein